jgi:hypothetical protein
VAAAAAHVKRAQRPLAVAHRNPLRTLGQGHRVRAAA